MNFKGRDIIDINDFSTSELLHILKVAKRFEAKADPDLLKGNIIALCFFEPSTRTEQSFKAAAQKIGGGIIGFNDFSLTSIYKGETFEDTIQIIRGYSDILVIRHSESGFAKKAADLIDIPVINAGDGPTQHPTQTMLDLYTIMKHFGKLDNLKIALVGDPKHYRSMHGLVIAMSKFSNNQIYGVSPKGLEMPDDLKNKNYHDVVIDMKDLNKTLADLAPDIVYVGRIPKEYMKEDTTKYAYQIDQQTLQGLSQETVIMHPLPRVGEINPEIDQDPRVIYFKQARNGLCVREALLALVLGKV